LPLLLDTSIAVELLDDVQRTTARVSQIDGLFLSVISWIELEAGIYRHNSVDPKRRARLHGFLEHIELLDFTGREVAAYSAILAAKGFSRRLVSDRMIAATAVTYGLTLATLNARDFHGIPLLTVEDWST
jgi:predicted nucleic acid-binding protein